MDTHETRAKSTFLFESAVARRSIIDKADVRMCHTTMQRCSSSSRGARHLPESVPSSSTPLAEHVEQKKLLRSCSSTNSARIHAPIIVSSARSHTHHDAPCVGCVKRRVPVLFFCSLMRARQVMISVLWSACASGSFNQAFGSLCVSTRSVDL